MSIYIIPARVHMLYVLSLVHTHALRRAYTSAFMRSYVAALCATSVLCIPECREGVYTVPASPHLLPIPKKNNNKKQKAKNKNIHKK